MTNGTKIISAIYELKYVEGINSERYKNFPLLVATIKNIIYPEYRYVIYTDQNSYDKFNLKYEFNFPNVEFKFKELNTSETCELIDRIRTQELSGGINYDRIYCVNNYLEVVLNKLKFLIDESHDCDNIFWIDAGLIGTSCHDGWRDYMAPLINSKNFLDKVVDKINQHGFIHLKGNSIVMNYETVAKFNDLFGVELKVVPGCLFGGTSEKVRHILDEYLDIFNQYLTTHNQLISEQEVLTAITGKHLDECYAFEFGDWLDLQRAFLDILDIYDETKYVREKCYV
jgi:hypothetical protein